MNPNNSPSPIPPPLPQQVSAVDQKIFEEYQRTHPTAASYSQSSIMERAIDWTTDQWRYNKKIFIPAVSAGLLVFIVTPVIMLANSSPSREVAQRGQNGSTSKYYAGEEAPRHSGDSTKTTDDEGNTENAGGLPSVDDSIPAQGNTIFDNRAPNDTVSEDESEYFPPEPYEPGGAVEEPPVPQDPGTTPPPPTPDTPTGKVASITAVTFNYAHWKPASGIDDAVRNLSSQSDIIGFQEFGPRDSRDTLSRVVKNCTSCGYAMYMPELQKGGNVPIIWKKAKFTLLSKGNMAVYEKQRVEDGAGGPIAHPKDITWVRLKEKTSGRVVVVINNHLIPSVDASGRPNRSKPQRVALYDKHITAVSNKAKQFLSGGNSVIVLGDFNVNYRSDSQVKHSMFPYMKMGNANMWANWRWLGALPDGTHGSGNRLIDYVFVSRGTKAVPVSHKILPKNGSDHHPVLTRIELRK